MMGQLITLPLRLSVRTASFFLRTSEEVVKHALALTGRTVQAEPRYEPAGAQADSGADNLYDGDGAQPSEATATTEAPPPPPSAPPRPARDPEPEVPSEPQPLVEEPVHVSEEPEIVEEFAEPGAENGAGAEVRIDEPWDGYARMSAKEVISRLSGSDAATLAAVNLYENAHHGRQTVLSAVERQLRQANRPSASN